MSLIERRVALVTGASRGIGRGVARELARQGAKVVVAARTMTPDEGPRVDGTGAQLPGSLQETVAEIEDTGGEALAVRCDLADTEQIAGSIAKTIEHFGRLDILVNNAMPQDTFVGRFWELPIEIYDGQMTAGPRAYYAAAWHAVPVMLEQGRRLIVNISSPGACVDFFGAAYCIGRAASDRMAQALANDLWSGGISFVSLWPTFVRTERVLMAASGGNPGFDVPADFDPSVDANSTDIVGTAIAHLAADPDVGKLSGKVLIVADLAKHYGFKDIDGRDAIFNPTASAMREQRGYLRRSLTYAIERGFPAMRAKLSPGCQEDLQQLLVHLMRDCDVLGKDETGRIVLQISVDDWTLARLLVFGSRAAALDRQSEPTKARQIHGQRLC